MAIWAELQGNPRLRIGLVAIFAILVLYGLLEWHDHLGQQRAQYRRSLGQLVRMQQHQQPAVWAERASEAQGELMQARARLWHNVSAGQAQAEVRDWIAVLLRQADAKASAVRVTEPDAAIDASLQLDRLPESLKSLRPLKARAEFNSDPAVLMAVLAGLNQADHRVVVDTLTVKPARSELALTFWFDLGPGAKP